jgi:hypothetical protein
MAWRNSFGKNGNNRDATWRNKASSSDAQRCRFVGVRSACLDGVTRHRVRSGTVAHRQLRYHLAYVADVWQRLAGVVARRRHGGALFRRIARRRQSTRVTWRQPLA